MRQTRFQGQATNKVKITSNVCPSKSFASHQFPHGSRTRRLLVRYIKKKVKAKCNKTRKLLSTQTHKLK